VRFQAWRHHGSFGETAAGAAACGGRRLESAKSGSGQLAAGLGGKQAERQPFNPVVWSQKLDSDGQFIRRHLPQLAHLDSRRIHAPWLAVAEVNTNGYPSPVVDYRAR